MIKGYKVQIEYDEPMPEWCSYYRFNYDWLYCVCVLDMDNRTTTSDEGRPSHCKLIPTEVDREVILCKDCRFANPYHRDGVIFCTYHLAISLDDGSCYHAEQRGEE